MKNTEEQIKQANVNAFRKGLARHFVCRGHSAEDATKCASRAVTAIEQNAARSEAIRKVIKAHTA